MPTILSDTQQHEGKRPTRIGTSIKVFLLLALLVGQVGCASTGDSADGSSDSDQPKHDDSNGWGTGIGMGH
jgi:hypothetical protein